MADDRNFLTNAADLGVSANSRAANMINSSQLGVGLNAATIDGATPQLFTPAVILVMQLPTMYDKKPQLGRMIKAVIESHAKSVTGLDFSYTLETSDAPVGHDGQQLAVPTKNKRSQVNPSFTFNEVTGNLIWNLFRQWMWDIQHPDTNASMASIAEVTAYTMSAYSMSMMAIQFDATMRPENILDAVFYTNMFPTTTGELGIERQIATSKLVERTIPFTALIQHNDYVRKVAVDMATKLQLQKVNYNWARTGTSAVQSSIADSGLQKDAAAAIAAYAKV